MEGLVRQLRKRLPQSDIAIVYTLTDITVNEYDMVSGRTPRIVSLWEELAEHYGIPSIHLGLKVLQWHNQGHVVWRAPLNATLPQDNVSPGRLYKNNSFIFSHDGIHPHASTGCREYVMAIERSLPLLINAGHDDPELELPAPMDPGNFENTQWIEPDRLHPDMEVAESVGQKVKLPYPASSLPSTLNAMYVAHNPSDTFTLHFQGTYIGVFCVVGPFSGDLAMTIDDGPSQQINFFGTFCRSTRVGFYPLHSGLDKGNHTLVINVAAEPPDKLGILAGKTDFKTFPMHSLNVTDFIPIAFCVA